MWTVGDSDWKRQRAVSTAPFEAEICVKKNGVGGNRKSLDFHAIVRPRSQQQLTVCETSLIPIIIEEWTNIVIPFHGEVGRHIQWFWPHCVKLILDLNSS
jgi:hypothetical protein